jgi:hypothetical protein
VLEDVKYDLREEEVKRWRQSNNIGSTVKEGMLRISK